MFSGVLLRRCSGLRVCVAEVGITSVQGAEVPYLTSNALCGFHFKHSLADFAPPPSLFFLVTGGVVAHVNLCSCIAFFLHTPVT